MSRQPINIEIEYIEIVRLLILKENNLFMKHSNIEVQVGDNIERALRRLKKNLEREGVVRDMKRIIYFEPPTQKRRKRLMRAIKQNLMNMASVGQLKR